ncbi:uncharacterized protein RSE6_09172 [Rhynchosporium secalis]|uniref:Uncharacterized protein n=1 Tax=Rhynchosporium secalis TaxID=38038 RepID=A0A1E1MHB1_RHYSE|nr:uncharacterized protein RSE6_09172 [Rhynchosporium secalis]
MAEREVSDRAEDQGRGSAGARDSDHCPSFIRYKVDRAGL